MSINKGYNDTPISGVTSLELQRGLINYKDDFRILSETPNEVVLTNLTAPLDRPEKFRIAYNVIKDVYRNTDIHPNMRAASSKGVNVLCQLTSTISEINDTDPTVRTDLPISAHIVLKFPAAAAITAALIQETVGRLVSGLYETGSTDVVRLQSLMRGSLLPSDI